MLFVLIYFLERIYPYKKLVYPRVFELYIVPKVSTGESLLRFSQDSLEDKFQEFLPPRQDDYQFCKLVLEMVRGLKGIQVSKVC